MKKALTLFISIVAMCLLVGCKGTNSPRERGASTNNSQAAAIPSAELPQSKPIVQAYIENSGSMDGYVKGETEFEQTIYNYLSDIKISKLTNTLALYYINSKVLPQGVDSGDLAVLKDFIKELEPNVFKQKGGNRGTSDIASVIDLVLKETGNNSISILVTDGIFSPGSGANAVDYLVTQEIDIKNYFANFLENEPDAAVIVYQLFSKFNGIYYNKVNAVIPFSGQRPYYMWVIGNAKNLAALRRAVPESVFQGNGVKNMFAISSHQPVNYAVNSSIGKFKRSKIDNKTIESLKKDSRSGDVRFAVNADFSKLLVDEKYLLNPDNYENNSRYAMEIKPAAAKNAGYTHTLTFRNDIVQKGTVSVKLKIVCPDWVGEANDEDGSGAVDGKTYGIKNQINGVYRAFTFSEQNKYYTEIKINII